MKNTTGRPTGKKHNNRVLSINNSSFTPERRKHLLFVALFAMIGGLILMRVNASPAMWTPTADKPLRLAWILEEGLTTDNIQTLQLKDLKGNPIPEADVYDIDGETTSKEVVDLLHARGKKVICYFDAGVYEDYRTDANKFPKSVIGAKDEGWDGSYWLDIRQISVLEPIMRARIQMCKDKGFDSIEPDEITNWSNNPGFPITYADQIKYNKALAGWAHGAGLSIGLKGDLEQAHDLADTFDWTLNEQCYEYNECTLISNEGPGADGKDHPGLQEFVKRNKAVWIAEYPKGDNGGGGSGWKAKDKDSSTTSYLTKAKTDSICNDSIKNRFNTAFYVTGLPLNGGRTDCPQFAPRDGSSGGGGPVTPVKPIVSLKSSNTNTNAPATFTLTATSNLPSTIDISQNNSVIASCSATTNCVFTAKNFQAGTYTFTAKAVTSEGGVGTSSNQVVTVGQGTTQPSNKAPVINLSGPDTSLTAPATITLSAQANDPDGTVAKVEFFKNGTSTGSVSKVPFTFGIKNVSEGTYSFMAKATDNSGAVTDSNIVKVTVAKQPPSNTSKPAAPVISDVSLGYQWWKGQCSLKTKCTMKIKWVPVQAATSYVIRSDGDFLDKVVASEFTDVEIRAGVDYNYEIYAKNSAGLSSPTKINNKVTCLGPICSVSMTQR